MIIDESEILDAVYYDECKALACLLASDICFLNVCNVSNSKLDNNPRYTTVVYVNVSDVFAWGCSDVECITNSDGEADSEIISLYKYWKENPQWGCAKWVCLKRNVQPQKAVIDLMKKANYWDDVLESLPVNKFNKLYENG